VEEVERNMFVVLMDFSRELFLGRYVELVVNFSDMWQKNIYRCF
jgi:hypothetical protein